MDWSFLKFNLKVIYLIQNITVAILLQITELLMEPVFICPCNELRICFVTTYFTVPAAALTAFALSHQEGKVFIEFPKCSGEKSQSCLQGTFQCLLSLLKILYPAMCWTVILLLDGKYAACGLYNKCNCTLCAVDLKDPELLNDMMKSKLLGFAIIAGFVLLYFIFLFWNCRQSAAYRYERMYLSQLEDDREEFAKKYMKMCSKKRTKECEKSLSRKTEVNPEAEDTTPPGATSTTPPVAVSATPPGAQGTTQPEVRRKTGLDLKHTTPPEAEDTTPPVAVSTTRLELRAQHSLKSGVKQDWTSSTQHRLKLRTQRHLEQQAELILI
ncbi:hypothetical protein GJAV_G00105350 [Gymnothorax javanicus]|nr:hypothetical protein GJAV_G00105350 [Gymnothorax javanicus]